MKLPWNFYAGAMLLLTKKTKHVLKIHPSIFAFLGTQASSQICKARTKDGTKMNMSGSHEGKASPLGIGDSRVFHELEPHWVVDNLIAILNNEQLNVQLATSNSIMMMLFHFL